MNVPSVKVVLKSTTTMTLSDRFNEMLRKKPAAVDNVSHRTIDRREKTRVTHQASAKNQRLAEQMSHRAGTHAIMDSVSNDSVKDRLGRDPRDHRRDVRDRLGGVSPQNDVHNRIGFRGRGNFNRGNFTPRGTFRGRGGRGGFNNRGRGFNNHRGSFRGRGRSSRGRSPGRGFDRRY